MSSLNTLSHSHSTNDQSRSNTTGGILHSAHHFVLEHPTLINQNVIHNYSNSDNTMNVLMDHAIRGAELDSSERDPPPSCHPGTRVTILEKAKSFFRDPEPPKRVFWLCGPAGVGKSAIVQTLAESLNEAISETDPRLGAAIFFSRPNQRDDPKRFFTTIAYQLSARYPFYRQYVAAQLANDPMFLDKSMSEQFKHLVTHPFAERSLYKGSKSLVILIDGLDECNGDREQMNIIRVICQFVLKHPHVPLLWVIASRPEPHIRDTFRRSDITTSFHEEYVPVDSDEACKDVEKFLRKSFEDIKEDYPDYFSESMLWPSETQILDVCHAARGLFAFADTAVRFIGDMEFGNPIAQLEEILTMVRRQHTPGKSAITGTLTPLKDLYTRILSSVPESALPIATFLMDLMGRTSGMSFAEQVNYAGISQYEAYSALRKLHSLLKIPSPNEAGWRSLSVYHTSLSDFWQSLRNSALDGGFQLDYTTLHASHCSCVVRILSQVEQRGITEVCCDGIELSWSTTDVPKAQKHLLETALDETPRIFVDDQLGWASSLIRSLKGLSLIGLTLAVSSPPTSYIFFNDALVFRVPRFARYRMCLESNFSRSTSISHFDGTLINMEAPAYVLCREEVSHSEMTTNTRGFVLEAVANLQWTGFHRDPSSGKEVYDHKGRTHIASGPLSQESLRPLLTDLQSLRENDPSKEIILWGCGKTRVAILRQDFHSESSRGSVRQYWLYLIPYPEP